MGSEENNGKINGNNGFQGGKEALDSLMFAHNLAQTLAFSLLSMILY